MSRQDATAQPAGGGAQMLREALEAEEEAERHIEADNHDQNSDDCCMALLERAKAIRKAALTALPAAAEAPDARDEVERLKAALVKYGCHTGMCGFVGGTENDPTGYRCVCGLYDLIDAEQHLATFEDGRAALSSAPAPREGAADA